MQWAVAELDPDLTAELTLAYVPQWVSTLIKSTIEQWTRSHCSQYTYPQGGSKINPLTIICYDIPIFYFSKANMLI